MNLEFSNTPIGRFRLTGITEGISFLILLGIAMPLKYYYNLPEMVKFTGWVHGLLFILYVIALAQVALVHRWPMKRVVVAFLASLIPFGTFLLDGRLRREQHALNMNS